MRRRTRVFSLAILCSGFFCGISPLHVLAQATASPSFDAKLPDSPGAMIEKSIEKSKMPAPETAPNKVTSAPISLQSLAMQSQEVAPQDQQVQPSQPQSTQAQSQSQSTTQRPPVGTAAAGVVPVSGIAASQPAGVAIAPAKQHRARTIVLRVGAIIGAGVAVGSIVALTEATSGKPPGAH
jgi:hypothetical protein